MSSNQHLYPSDRLRGSFSVTGQGSSLLRVTAPHFVAMVFAGKSVPGAGVESREWVAMVLC